jgi:hypothetical protein
MVLREQSRENPQGLDASLTNRTGYLLTIDPEENYQPSTLYLGFSVETISAENLDSKSGPLRILEEVIPEDGKDLETYYLIQREGRKNEKMPKTPYIINKLWFEHYLVPETEMIRSSIGRNLLVQCDLQASLLNSSSCLKTTLSNCP